MHIAFEINILTRCRHIEIAPNHYSSKTNQNIVSVVTREHFNEGTVDKSMDHSIYDESTSKDQGVVPYTISLKPSFTLDFNSARSRQPMDVGFFKLGSPDLERFLVQSDGSVVTALTPTTQILFPKSVTEEQEAYARGFIDALEELHRRQGIPSSSLSLEESLSSMSSKNSGDNFSISNICSSSAMTLFGQVDVPLRDGPLSINKSKTAVLPPAQTLLNRSSATISFDAGYSHTSTSLSNTIKSGNILSEEGYQTVPKLISSPPSSSAASLSGDSPSPMSANEDFDRLELKRARNRLAAQKCRSRKLERIAVLSQRVEELKEQNACLQILKHEASKNVEELKSRLSQHAHCGSLDLSMVSMSS